MVDLRDILLNKLMKTYTPGEFTLTKGMLLGEENHPLIAYRLEDGTIKVRTHEYNERCVDKW